MAQQILVDPERDTAQASLIVHGAVGAGGCRSMLAHELSDAVIEMGAVDTA
ncbi:hypothetical protein LJR296_000569 [Cupriavidus necator]|uniref:hypothetical protein n=1 Tax=Cupriavidus necator TaxID=106590 RepID=UPI003ECDE71A